MELETVVNWEQLSCGCWEFNLGPLEDQSMLLTTHPFLLPLTDGFFFKHFLLVHKFYLPCHIYFIFITVAHRCVSLPLARYQPLRAATVRRSSSVFSATGTAVPGVQ